MAMRRWLGFLWVALLALIAAQPASADVVRGRVVTEVSRPEIPRTDVLRPKPDGTLLAFHPIPDDWFTGQERDLNRDGKAEVRINQGRIEA